MKKYLLVNVLIFIFGYAISNAGDEVNINAYPKEFFVSLSPFDSKGDAAQVNIYVVKSEDLNIYLHKIVVLPANYQQKYIDCNQERYRDLKGFRDEMTSDSSIKWAKALTDRVKNRINGPLPGEFNVIIGTKKDNDDYLRRWGGKVFHDSICDSISNIVANAFLSVCDYKLILPIKSGEIFDSTYNSLDDGDKQLWDAYIYPQKGSNSLPIDNKKIDRLSNVLFNNLDTDAYVTIDVIYNKTTRVSFNKKDPTYEIRGRMYCKVAIFGPGFRVLWSSEFPISKNTKKDKYAYEIIDYKMANKNIRRTLLLLNPNKSGEKR